MDYSHDVNSTDPRAHDYAILDGIYAHLDTTTTVGVSSGRNAAQVGDDRSSWRRGVHTYADGKHSIFIRDFGGGDG